MIPDLSDSVKKIAEIHLQKTMLDFLRTKS